MAAAAATVEAELDVLKAEMDHFWPVSRIYWTIECQRDVTFLVAKSPSTAWIWMIIWLAVAHQDWLARAARRKMLSI